MSFRDLFIREKNDIIRTMKTDEFFASHNFKSVMITDGLVQEMTGAFTQDKSLKDKGRGPDMFKTWLTVPEQMPSNTKIIVIDAGGTNFRSCLVTIGENGKFSVSDFRKTFMPALDREFSKDEFFNAIADNIDYLKDKACRIGFCFSYAMEITKDGDGIPNAFSKEIRAKAVLGQPVGKNLLEVLNNRGWKNIESIKLLNDTAAALLAGCACSARKNYGSYIGFILGTGINAAIVYKNDALKIERQIIVEEIGKSVSVPLSDFDIEFDKTTENPGQYPLEKCCSGAYMGGVVLKALYAACKEGLFSTSASQSILKIKALSTIEVNNYLSGQKSLFDFVKEESDKKTLFAIMDAFVDRCAKIAASIIESSLILTAQGGLENTGAGVCVLCNGSTFYRMHALKERIEFNLNQSKTVQNGLKYELMKMDDDICIGTAVAGLV